VADVLVLEGVIKRFGQFTAVDDFSLRLPAGYRVSDVTGRRLRAEAGRPQTAPSLDTALPVPVEFPAGPGDRSRGTLVVAFAAR
jgi:hypothetical protein